MDVSRETSVINIKLKKKVRKGIVIQAVYDIILYVTHNT